MTAKRPVKKKPARYPVIGAHTVDGVAAGGTVEITDPDRARALYRGGHIGPRRGESFVAGGDDR